MKDGAYKLITSLISLILAALIPVHLGWQLIIFMSMVSIFLWYEDKILKKLNKK
jgi:hypothetical protein